MADMNQWIWAALLLLPAILPCMLVMVRGSTMDALIALQCVSGICVAVLVVLAQALNRSSFVDAAILLALLNYPAGLLFAHFFERWL